MREAYARGTREASAAADPPEHGESLRTKSTPSRAQDNRLIAGAETMHRVRPLTPRFGVVSSERLEALVAREPAHPGYGQGPSSLGPLPGTYPEKLTFFFFFQAEDGIRDLIVTGV